jgi:hypothetical protein
MAGVITKSITAQNTFSDELTVTNNNFNFSLSGTWVATVTVQRKFYNESDWLDVEEFTSNIETVGYEPEKNAQYRFGVKTGDFTSGTVVGRLGKFWEKLGGS